MKREETIKKLKEAGFEIISREEWMQLNRDGEGRVLYKDEDDDIFFKLPETPKVFENSCKKIIVEENSIKIIDKIHNKEMILTKDKSLPTLIEAIEEYENAYQDFLFDQWKENNIMEYMNR